MVSYIWSILEALSNQQPTQHPNNRCSIPSTPALPAFDSKSIELIRSHRRVYTDICYQLVELILAASIIMCSIHVRPQAVISMARRIEELHGNIEFFDELKTSTEASMTMYELVPLFSGIIMGMINLAIIHQCFQYGINMTSNICGITATITICFILASGSFFLLLDASHYPHDAAGATKDNIYLFMHVMKVALDKEDPILYHIVHMFHEKLECCGFHGVDDYYAQRQIDYHPFDGEESWRYTFRVSNKWVSNCSTDAANFLNSTYVCYAPEFCCSHGEDSNSFMGACPPAKWDGIGRLKTSNRMHKHPCAWRIAQNFYDKVLNIMVLSIVNLLTAATNAIHMLGWSSKIKSPSSTAAVKAN